MRMQTSIMSSPSVYRSHARAPSLVAHPLQLTVMGLASSMVVCSRATFNGSPRPPSPLTPPLLPLFTSPPYPPTPSYPPFYPRPYPYPTPFNAGRSGGALQKCSDRTGA